MKPNLLLLATAALALSACSGNDSSIIDREAKEEPNRQTALESVRAVNTHDMEAIFRDAVPGLVDYGDGSMGRIQGVDTIKGLMKTWLAAFPDVKRDKLVAVADGEWVMVWGTWSGTFTNDLMGIKATGKAYKDVPDVDIFKFNEEGKIIEHHTIQSPNTFLIKAGAQMPGK